MKSAEKRRGFSLIELMVAVAIAGIILTMASQNLGKARTAGGSRGLATAVSSEFKFAREKAISTGSPVAVIIPAKVGRSMFWLEGTTQPTVTRAVNFEGDYPRGALTVATYAGPSFRKNATMPGFKAAVWGKRLETWLPKKYHDDFVFVFTPNGSVITNDLPSADGSFRVIVGMGADVSKGSAPSGSLDYIPGNSPYYNLKAAGEPYTVALSLGGAVESDKGLLGYDGGSINTSGGSDATVAKPPHPVYDWDAKSPTIFFSRVTPPAEDVDGKQMHVLDKGEYLTLEVFARSGDGKPIFADWDDKPQTHTGPQYQGAFSVPDGEAERMEFYPELEVDGKKEENVWRSVWTWTPPKAAEAGDIYDLEIKVKDAKGDFPVTIKDLPPVTVAPPGEIIFERQVGAYWHLFTMWADGSRQKKITKGPHNYTCASATGDGKMIAFQRDSEVWVMNSDGSGQTRISNSGQLPTISPTGNSIAYMSMDGSQVIVKRLNAGGATVSTGTTRTDVIGSPSPGNRLAYSPDGRRLYFTSPTGNRVNSLPLSFSGSGISKGPVQDPGASIPNLESAPEVGGLSADRSGKFVYYHGDHDDPYIGRYSIQNPGYALGGIVYRESNGENEACPAPAPDGSAMLFVQGGTIFSVPEGNFAISAAGTPLAAGRRPAWIKQRP